jgi:hypothetical protein
VEPGKRDIARQPLYMHSTVTVGSVFSIPSWKRCFLCDTYLGYIQSRQSGSLFGNIVWRKITIAPL